MKNIFEHHVREIHITEDRKLRLRVANIDQAIEALETIKQGLDQLGPKCPEFEMDLKKQLMGSESHNCEKAVSRIEISFVEKQKTHHRDVYIIKVFPDVRDHATVIINEDDVDAVKARLVKLVKRFEQERKKSHQCDNSQSTGRVQRITPQITVYTLPISETKCGVSGQMLSRLKQLEITTLDLAQSGAYVEQRKLLVNRKKESE